MKKLKVKFSKVVTFKPSLKVGLWHGLKRPVFPIQALANVPCWEQAPDYCSTPAFNQ